MGLRFQRHEEKLFFLQENAVRIEESRDNILKIFVKGDPSPWYINVFEFRKICSKSKRFKLSSEKPKAKRLKLMAIESKKQLVKSNRKKLKCKNTS